MFEVPGEVGAAAQAIADFIADWRSGKLSVQVRITDGAIDIRFADLKSESPE